MAGIQHRTVDTNGIRMAVAECGEGPLVVLLHGWPDSWYSYRHQLSALADAGYRAVAPNQRGYAGTTAPDDLSGYVQLHMVGDVMGLLDHYGEERAVVVGHDWGAIIAWYCALLRPDRIRGVAALSVPYFPRMPFSLLTGLRTFWGERAYMQYFQEPGVAEKEFEADIRATVRRVLWGFSGDAPNMPAPGIVPEDGGFLDLALDPPDMLPAWLTEADIDVYVAEFEQSGFTGPLNWYRAIEPTWTLMSPWHMAPVLTPALFVGGDKDVLVTFPGAEDVVNGLKAVVPNLVETIVLPGCGHWTQQERPTEVSEALIRFIGGL
jgi:pimeloyl-ACP methyl ester carboxylesterase